MPVYNAERYLNDSVGSILTQSYSNWELILIDDKSSDKSTQIIDTLKSQDKRIHLLKNSKNAGAAMTRNSGIAHASGRFIAFLDADDLWHPQKLEKQVRFMLENNHIFTFTSYAFVSSAGNKEEKKAIVPRSISYKNALKRSPISTITAMIDTASVAKDDINMPNYLIGEDTATWWHLLKKYGDAYSLSQVLSYYRRGESGTLSGNKVKAATWRWRLYRQHEGMPLLRALYHFVHYIVYAVQRRV